MRKQTRKKRIFRNSVKHDHHEHLSFEDHELQTHHDFRELSQLIQGELNTLLENSSSKKQKKSKKRRSPYVVNLKNETTTQQKNGCITTKHNEINLIVFDDADIDYQFTPLFESPAYKDFHKRAARRPRLRVFFFSAFLIVAGLFTLSLTQLLQTQKYILALSENALSNIQQGVVSAQASDFTNANVHFSMATREFIEAEKELESINPIVQEILLHVPGIGEQFATGFHSIKAGSRLALTAKFATQGFETIKKQNKLSDKLAEIKDISKDSAPLINEAIYHINQVDIEQIPAEKRFVFTQMQQNLPRVQLILNNFINLSDFIVDASGHTEKKRYLIPFQNNTELRSSGGFIGSFALIDIYKGEIVNIEIPNDGSYQLQGGLQKNIRPPQPLQLIAERWEFQDSNWDADFRTAANQIENLFTLSWGPSVDGVITVNLPVMEQLLTVLGPVQLNEYGLNLSEQNFWQEVQDQVENKYDPEQNNPKQIITDMAPIILDRIQTAQPEDVLNILLVFNKALLEKNILMNFKDAQSQSLIEEFGWAGEITEAPHDYFGLFVNNIAGGKTDRVINQTIHFESDIQESGDIINTVTIKRQHTGKKGDAFTGIRNVAYLRAYVPEGAELISFEGAEIPEKKYFKEAVSNAQPDAHTVSVEQNMIIRKPSDTVIANEYNKTVFGNWSMVDPGGTAEITIRYKLPRQFNFMNEEQSEYEHSLVFQKQSGINSTLSAQFKLPQHLEFQRTETNKHFELIDLTTDIERDLTIQRK